MLHDIGYIFSYFAKMEQKIWRNFTHYNVNILHSLWSIKRIWKDSLIYKYLADIRNKNPNNPNVKNFSCYRMLQEIAMIEDEEGILKPGHGAVGAINLLMFIEKINRKNNLKPEHHLMFQWAALAIFCHEMKNFYKKYGGTRVSFREDFISAFLILADQLNEWEREKVVIKPPKNESYIKMGFECPCSEVTVNLDYRKNSSRPIFKVSFPSLTENKIREELIDNDHFREEKQIYHYGFSGREPLLDCECIFERIEFPEK